MAESSSTAVLDQQPFPVDPTPAPAQPNPISTSTPTLLTYLHALFEARQSQNLTLPYLQPFAPLSSRPLPRTNSSGNGGDRGKGKEKVKIDLDVIRELRESVASWRGVLTKENQEGGRLTTALKEVFVSIPFFFFAPHLLMLRPMLQDHPPINPAPFFRRSPSPSLLIIQISIPLISPPLPTNHTPSIHCVRCQPPDIFRRLSIRTSTEQFSYRW